MKQCSVRSSWLSKPLIGRTTVCLEKGFGLFESHIGCKKGFLILNKRSNMLGRDERKFMHKNFNTTNFIRFGDMAACISETREKLTLDENMPDHLHHQDQFPMGFH